MDQRFATKLAKDARFKKIPKSQFKVEIDERFKNVFSKDNDKEKGLFYVSCVVFTVMCVTLRLFN